MPWSRFSKSPRRSQLRSASLCSLSAWRISMTLRAAGLRPSTAHAAMRSKMRTARIGRIAAIFRCRRYLRASTRRSACKTNKKSATTAPTERTLQNAKLAHQDILACIPLFVCAPVPRLLETYQILGCTQHRNLHSASRSTGHADAEAPLSASTQSWRTPKAPPTRPSSPTRLLVQRSRRGTTTTTSTASPHLG